MFRGALSGERACGAPARWHCSYHPLSSADTAFPSVPGGALGAAGTAAYYNAPDFSDVVRSVVSSGQRASRVADLKYEELLSVVRDACCAAATFLPGRAPLASLLNLHCAGRAGSTAFTRCAPSNRRDHSARRRQQVRPNAHSQFFWQRALA